MFFRNSSFSQQIVVDRGSILRQFLAILHGLSEIEEIGRKRGKFRDQHLKEGRPRFTDR